MRERTPAIGIPVISWMKVSLH